MITHLLAETSSPRKSQRNHEPRLSKIIGKDRRFDPLYSLIMRTDSIKRTGQFSDQPAGVVESLARMENFAVDDHSKKRCKKSSSDLKQADAGRPTPFGNGFHSKTRCPPSLSSSGGLGKLNSAIFLGRNSSILMNLIHF